MKLKETVLDIVKRIRDPENRTLVISLICCSILVGVLVGVTVGGDGADPHSGHAPTVTAAKKEKAQVWTCSMHPHVRENKPGKCPLCGMDLIPLESDEQESGGEYTVKLSGEAIKLAEIQTTAVKREFLASEIRMVGKIDFDETRLAHIAAWFPGRIENLYVDYTGVKVNKGDHMVQIYSPEILAAQEELLQAIKAVKNISASAYSGIRGLTKETVNDVRSKLRLWGFSRKQIAQIERRKKTSNKMVVYAPVGGVVIKKYVQEGMYVKTGSKIYSIADLSHLWVKLDVYESDIHSIRYGQDVNFFTESFPGLVFKGKISFIDPVLNSKTQTIKIRANVDNNDGKLRPGMFVHAKVFSKISTTGTMMDELLKNKFICPMHPEIIKDSKGRCPICAMDLVSTKTLGYEDMRPGHLHTAPLVIPVSAALQTGERAVVYISLGEGKYEGRQITLGPKVGDHYIVLDGIKEGEEVVTNGSFKIDSAAQLMAKPSMMNPDGGVPAPTGHSHHNMTLAAAATSKEKYEVSNEFQKQFDNVIISYYAIHQALAEDKFKMVAEHSKLLLKNMETVNMSLLKGKAHMKWMEMGKKIRNETEKIVQAKDIDSGREHFKNLSDAIIKVINIFGTSGNVKTNNFFCPMAFGSGAYWLQESETTQNPYYGQSMLTCGEKRNVEKK